MKEKSFTRCAAHLPVRNLRQTLDYYRNTLGFYEEWTTGEIDGGIRRDNMRLLFAEDAAFVNDMNTTSHRLPLLWFVDNIEAVFEEFGKRGIEITEPLQRHTYGLREFSFIDINGYYIRIAEPVDE